MILQAQCQSQLVSRLRRLRRWILIRSGSGEASLKGKKKNKGVKRTLGLWQRMEELKRQGLWVGPDEPNKEAKKARMERDGKGKGK